MFGWDDAAAVALKLIDRVIPDPQAKAAAAMELQRMQQAGEFKQLEADLQMAQMQADINKVEAGSTNMFVAGPRPAIMWVGAGAMAWQFLIGPMFQWLSTLAGHATPMPELDTAQLFNLITLLLGLGAYRSYEKKNGVAS